MLIVKVSAIVSILLVASVLVSCGESETPFNYYRQGTEFAEHGRYDEAITKFTKAIELDPDYVKAYNARAKIYRDTEKYVLAIADYCEVILLTPNDAMAHFRRSYAYRLHGEYDLAIADANRAIELDPNLAEAYLVIGSAYYHKEQYDMAIVEYNKVLELDANLAEAVYAGRFGVYQKQGRNAEAKAELELFITVSDDPQLIEGAKKEIEKLSQ